MCSETKNNAHPSRTIVFFGSPLVDVTTRVGGRFLERYKLQPDNAYRMDETLEAIFDEIAADCSLRIGGSVTNTVRIFRKLSPSLENVAYFGAIGRDSWGLLIKKQLEQEGIGADLNEVIGGSTGRVAVLLVDKARTLVTDLGASQNFALDKNTRAKLDRASHVYISGFFINVSFDTITQITSKSDKTIAFNLGAPFLCTNCPQQMIHLYRHSTVVFGNEAEHRAFAEISNITSKSLVEAVIATNRLHNNRSRVVVVTRGGGPVLVVENCDWTEYEVTALDQATIVDTNGAGDAFVGGFLARYVEGDSVANCVRCGIRVAKLIIQNEGFNFSG